MPTHQLDEFSKKLVQLVRDLAIRDCDSQLQSHARSPVARRWREHAEATQALRVAIPDIVDNTVFALLYAIDAGLLSLKYVADDGREVDLCEEGESGLAGSYMASGGWRATYSAERLVDDFADQAVWPVPPE